MSRNAGLPEPRSTALTDGVPLALALAAPWIALSVAGAGDPRGLAPAPFGWPSMVVVHLAAAFPLSVFAAVLLSSRRCQNNEARWQSARVWTAAALVLTVAAIAMGAKAGTWLDVYLAGVLAADAVLTDAAVRSGLRTAVCLILQLPWCLAAIHRGTGRGVLRLRPRFAGWAIAAAAALLLPAAYADHFARQQLDRAQQFEKQGRLWRAWCLVQGLTELGSAHSPPGRPLRYTRDALLQRVEAALAAVSEPFPAAADDWRRLARAEQLVALDELQDAEVLLRNVAPRNPHAAMYLARVLQAGGKWAESRRLCEQAIDLLGEHGASDHPDRLHLLQMAYDELAASCRQEGRPEQAVAAYHEALARMPEAQGHFHLQLGRHYQLAGRPRLAAWHLAQAAEYDAGLAAPAAAVLRQLNFQTPSCLFGPARAGELAAEN